MRSAPDAYLKARIAIRFFQTRSVFCDTRHAGRDSIRLSTSGELENSRVLQMRLYAERS